MRVLVTGHLGFAGSRLAASLEADGHAVAGFDARAGQDVRDYEQVRRAVEAHEPDEVYHLAAMAWPGESMADPRRCLDVNLTGTLNVLEACRMLGARPRILLAGTSEEYGYEGRPAGAVLDEDSACAPSTPYGVSKLAATALGMTYARRHGLHVVATRAFNHTGAGRPSCNAESAFARRIAAVERGEADHVPHGDLSAVRDFCDAADVVRAYRLAVSAPPGIYNVCSGRPVPLTLVMGILLAQAGLDGAVLKQDPALGRADAGPFPATTHAKLTAATGWEPSVPLEETLAAVLAYWRSR